MQKVILFVFLLAFAVSSTFAGNLAGKVTAKTTGQALVGANVYLKGTSIGAATDEDGMYFIKADDGEYTVVCDYVSYSVEQAKITISGDTKQDFQLTEYLFAKTIEVLADRAIERETPVAFSNVSKEKMEVTLGSRDIPMVMNSTPSVYATQSGGGAGDARINVRGFNQRNVAIMINGVPVNDMENGWVYWSNWDGVGDATASIQMQRGLSAVNLATPSIGGTMNIITDPTAADAGFKFKQEFGNDGFLKSTLVANSGLIGGKFAFNGAVVRKTGDGLIDKTWTDAWAYYMGATWNINDANRLEIYGMGAPQRHGQNLYMQNIAAYDQDYAKSLKDYDEAAFSKFQEEGRRFNQNWAPVSSSYTGKQYTGNTTESRYNKNFLNERENFYHKPIVNLNWYSNLTKDLSLFTVVYWSGGIGGGTGTYGKIVTNDNNGVPGTDSYKFYYGPSPWVRNWDATIAMNQGAAGDYYVDKSKLTKIDGQSLGILRNSRNNQTTIGAISKAVYRISENLKTTIGVDWRTAEIEHYREVRDLLGGQFWINTDDEFNPNQQIGLGDKVAYNFTNTVDWIGGFAQMEYTKDRTSMYGMFGYSTIKYNYTNHFRKGADGKELTAESDLIGGYQIKGGINHRATDQMNVYANFGIVSKVPIFDDVIDDYNGIKDNNYENQDFYALEVGSNYFSKDRTLNLKTNLYYTKWNNRTFKNTEFPIDGGDEVLVFLKGVNAEHYGFEAELGYQPSNFWRLDAAGSIGNWTYTKDVDGEARVVGTGNSVDYRFYIAGLHVGDAPQTQLSVAGTVFPMKGMMFQVMYRYYARYWSEFNPFDRTNSGDRAQSWRVPDYGVMDFHFRYQLPVHLMGVKFELFSHVYNVLNETYIQDAVDNSQYNAYTSNGKTHSADDAEVFLGLPLFFNVGLSLHY